MFIILRSRANLIALLAVNRISRPQQLADTSISTAFRGTAAPSAMSVTSMWPARSLCLVPSGPAN
jgi:hypothetical protein